MKVIKVKRVIRETPRTVTLEFNENFDAVPGQFFMLWIPGVSEKPFSISHLPALWITIMDVGCFSHKLCSLLPGDKIGIRGPYGNGFEIDKKINGKEIKNILAVGGGVGLAPLMPLIENAGANKNFTVIIGALSAKEVLFKERLNKIQNKNKNRVIITTDDGSEGICGYATQPIDDLLKSENFDLIVACGPEPMLLCIHKIAEKFEIPVQLSLDRFMKCGIGICGACAINGLLVCKDGPVFSGDELRNTDFGKCKRDKSGVKI